MTDGHVTELESRSVFRDLAALVDRYQHDAATADQQTAITNLASLLRHSAAFTAALTREIDHYANDTAEAQADTAVLRDELAEAQSEIRRLASDLAVAREQLATAQATGRGSEGRP